MQSSAVTAALKASPFEPATPPSAPVYARASDAALPAPKSWLMVTSELQPNAAVQYKAVIA